MVHVISKILRRPIKPWGSPVGSDGKEPTCCSAGDLGSIPGLGRSSGGGHGKPLQDSMENSMDRGAWRTTVYGVTKSWTQLSDSALKALCLPLFLSGKKCNGQLLVFCRKISQHSPVPQCAHSLMLAHSVSLTPYSLPSNTPANSWNFNRITSPITPCDLVYPFDT